MPPEAQIIWRSSATHESLGGVAATGDIVVFGDRDPLDQSDLFCCVDAETGESKWVLTYPAPGELDYGNSPRATPLILDDRVILLGAMGNLHCVDRKTGAIIWKKDLARDFGDTQPRPWGFCESPLLAERKLIVRPGSKDAAIVAISPADGSTIWKTGGAPPAYGSLLLTTADSVTQVIGYDDESLGGWDVASGARLWKFVSETKDDFNVPMPVRWGSRLLVASENNGTQILEFTDGGRSVKGPIAVAREAAPDMTSPVVIQDTAFVLFGSLHRLALDRKEVSVQASVEDDAFRTYGSLIASPGHLLVVGSTGEILLYDTSGEALDLVSRMRIFDPMHDENYAHPAIVGSRMYLRGAREVVCISLEELQGNP